MSDNTHHTILPRSHLSQLFEFVALRTLLSYLISIELIKYRLNPDLFALACFWYILQSNCVGPSGQRCLLSAVEGNLQLMAVNMVHGLICSDARWCCFAKWLPNFLIKPRSPPCSCTPGSLFRRITWPFRLIPCTQELPKIRCQWISDSSGAVSVSL